MTHRLAQLFEIGKRHRDFFTTSLGLGHNARDRLAVSGDDQCLTSLDVVEPAEKARLTFTLTSSRAVSPYAMARARDRLDITPDILLRAYSIGLFPMAESGTDPNLFWVDPDERGIFPLDGLSISRSLAKTVRSDRYEVRIDSDFDAVIDSCAKTAPGRDGTWINDRIRTLYRALFDMGHVHTIECWEDGVLVGGLYGVTLGAAFFGESMFHRARDASKIALVHLVARLRAGGFQLLDTQFVTDHLASLGAIAVPKKAYHLLLAEAVARKGDFWALPEGRRVSGAEALALLAGQPATPR